MYMDDISKMLKDDRVGCYIDNVCIYHVFYADNLGLVAPFAKVLQELLNICRRYGISVDLNLNDL